MSNMLTEYQQEVRTWDDDKLAYAIDHLNDSRDHKRLYTGTQKKDIRDEASRRLRWGRKAEGDVPKDFQVIVSMSIGAVDPDQAKDDAEAVLQAIKDQAVTGVHFTFEIMEVNAP